MNKMPTVTPWRILPIIVIMCLLLSSACQSLSTAERHGMRENIRAMFSHAHDNYMQHAFPHDELKPISRTWTDSLCELGNSNAAKHTDYHGVALTLIDSLSTLAAMGNVSELHRAIDNVRKHVSFDVNVRVNLFEANIRLLGGLLSAHALVTDDRLGLRPANYTDDVLLTLATSLGDRMMPAFSTATGLPYAWVNLATGVEGGETHDQCTAGVGTLILECGLLSYYTNNLTYYRAARQALTRLFAMKSPIHLFGNTLDIHSAHWTNGLSGIGAGIDSFYEYLLKGAVMFDDSELYRMFDTAYTAVMRHVYARPWYIEADMNNGQPVHLQYQSLQSFWPGVQAMVGDIDRATETFQSFYSVWQRYGSLPERWLLPNQVVHNSERYYPLRPELMESCYHLYRATRDPHYLAVGTHLYHSLISHNRVAGGFAGLRDVESKEQEDHQSSFFLAETCKYLYLLFDEENWVHDSDKHGQWMFTTEGHLFPIIRDIQRLLGDDSGEFGSDSARISEQCPTAVAVAESQSWMDAVDAVTLSQSTMVVDDQQCMAVPAAPVTALAGAPSMAGITPMPPVPLTMPGSVPLPAGIGMHQLQHLMEQALLQQQQQQQAQPAGDYLVKTGNGVFLIERQSTGELVEARSLGSLCIEIADKTRDGSVQSRIVTPRGVYGYRVVIHGSGNDRDDASDSGAELVIDAVNAYFGASQPPGVAYEFVAHSSTGGPATPLQVIQRVQSPRQPTHSMDVTAPVIDSVTKLGCSPLPPNIDYSGSIVIVERGSCTFVNKALAAEAAGALGLIVINNEDSMFVLGHGTETVEPDIPLLMITLSQGTVLRQLVDDRRSRDLSVTGSLKRFADIRPVVAGVRPTSQSHGSSSSSGQLAVRGTLARFWIETIDGFAVEIEEGANKVYQLRIQ